MNYTNSYSFGVNSPQVAPPNNLYQNNSFVARQPYFVGNSGIIYATLEEVGAEKVFPNDSILRIDRTGDVLYIKSADSLGRTNIDVFDLVKRTEEKQVKDYVTREEVLEIIKQSLAQPEIIEPK